MDPHGADLTRAALLCEACEENPRSPMYGRLCFACYRAIGGFEPLVVDLTPQPATVRHIQVDRRPDRPARAPRSICRWPDCTRTAHAHGCCRTHVHRFEVLATTAPAIQWPQLWEEYLEAKRAERAGRWPRGGPCRWPKCGKTSATLGYCKRCRKRIAALGLTGEDSPDLAAVRWEERQRANFVTWQAVGLANGLRRQRGAA